MSKFVVTETSFEYNDEVHSITEEGGGTPVAVFDTQKEADDYARARTVNDFLKGWCGDQLAGFGYEIESIFKSRPSFLDMSDDDFFGMDEHYYNLDERINIKDRSDAELEEIARCLAFLPYAVTEVQ